MKIVVSAPGKLHLAGEHAVVYGKPAVLVATSKRLYVTLSDRQTQKSTTIVALAQENKLIAAVKNQIEKKYTTEVPNLFIEISSDIPIGAGMGSSAALAVAVTAALVTYLDKPWNAAEINELAFAAEKVQHGTPSGGDNTIATYGGMLWYRKEFDFLKTFWLLPFKFPKSFVPFVLINTGRVETTKQLVETVAQMSPDKREKVCNALEKTTKQLVAGIHDENESEVQSAITNAELLLEKLGIVSTSVKRFIRELEKSGGVAKISGAGGTIKGSGIVLAMHKHPESVRKIAQKYNLPSFGVQLGGEGMKVEQVIV